MSTHRATPGRGFDHGRGSRHGFPLTIFLLSGWLQRKYPALDLLSHDAGHLWDTLLGWQGDPHLNPLHLLSGVFIGGGFILLARS